MDPEVSPHSTDGKKKDALSKRKGRLSPERSKRSLLLLATRFVKLLQEAEDGVLDLQNAVTFLDVRQKRRIYDITNVLEGIGLIVKISQRIVKWIGDLSEVKRLRELTSELEKLQQMECILDQQKLLVEESVRNITKYGSNLTYVHHEDICNAFSGNTLLAVKAPSGTKLDVPIPKAVQDSPVRYQIYLKSCSGPIEVVLLNKSSVSSVPVVLPVPPPEEILRSAKLAMSASNETQSSDPHCQSSAHTTNNTKCRRTSTEDTQSPHAQTFLKTGPHRAGASKWPDLSRELRNLLESPKEMMNANLITKLMASQGVF